MAAKLQLKADDITDVVALPNVMVADDEDVAALTERAELNVHIR